MMNRVQITSSISIGKDELEESFVRASGPGGQNVNKVASAVQLRFNVAASPSLPEGVRQRLLESGDSRLTRDGVLVITAERHRSQAANREDALERLAEIIRKAAHVPRKRVATRPTLASKKRRLEAKTRRGNIKKTRGGRIDAD
jgi:ribosome-associated protein